jgi:hypothetical protein
MSQTLTDCLSKKPHNSNEFWNLYVNDQMDLMMKVIESTQTGIDSYVSTLTKNKTSKKYKIDESNERIKPNIITEELLKNLSSSIQSFKKEVDEYKKMKSKPDYIRRF